MGKPRGVNLKAVAAGLVVLVVVGGFVLAVLSPMGTGSSPGGAPVGGLDYAATNGQSGFTMGAASARPLLGGLSSSLGTVSTVTMSTTTEMAPQPQSQVVGAQQGAPAPSQPSQTNETAGGGRMIEFFSNMTMESQTPSALASRVVGYAFSVGGYVATQSTYSGSAYVVVRVPAPEYEQTLTQVEAMGNVTSLVSNSNDVTVKYTDLNATLVSLEAEQQALLRLINGTTRVNDTLAVESTLQSVDAQINVVESEILQTQRLVAFSTISVSISKSVQEKPLALSLTATPKSGVDPLSVTFDAVVSGGQAPYLVNYNFGDGTSQEGGIVIHQFYRPGDYNVTVTATDSKGGVALASVLVKVSPAPSTVGFGNFPSSLADLFVRVLEGMATVAVIVLPPAAVLVAVAVPLRRRNRARAEVTKQ